MIIQWKGESNYENGLSSLRYGNTNIKVHIDITSDIQM